MKLVLNISLVAIARKSQSTKAFRFRSSKNSTMNIFFSLLRISTSPDSLSAAHKLIFQAYWVFDVNESDEKNANSTFSSFSLAIFSVHVDLQITICINRLNIVDLLLVQTEQTFPSTKYDFWICLLLAAWKIIRSWLPPEADQFIKFVDNKTIKEFVSADQLSTSMGGLVSRTEIEPIKDPWLNDMRRITFDIC